MGKLLPLLVILFAVIYYFKIKPIFNFPEKPHVTDIWWGPGVPSKTDTSIKPFKINVSNDMLQDLQNRLKNHIPFHPPLEGVHQNYGMNTNLLNKIVDFWKTKYDWREREKFLNQFPQFTVNIQGLNIHYIHVKPKQTKGVKVLPMLLLHGWPGSVREFYEMIPMLTAPQKGGSNIAFEVIVPSLPGYGFSDAAVRLGLNALHIANIFKNFMNRLGFEKYYLQGGDWGSFIAQLMASLYPQNVIGMHTNTCFLHTPLQFIKTVIGSICPSLIGIPKEHEWQLYPMSEKFSDVIVESGYMHLQATKPDTVGVALRDSPVGLAAYIIEKFITWTNPNWKNLDEGGLTKKFSYEKLIDNVMIYWVTRSITTSMRLYAESFNKNYVSLVSGRLPIEVPTACPKFNHEVLVQPNVILKERFLNIIHSPDYEGGHFAALEVPNVLAKDVFEFVEKVENMKTER